MSLAHPALLWGLTALAVPVLIHLLLRPRPRRVRFPALAFMRATLVASQRASRLRHWLLLLVRMSLLALVALLLASPTCRPLHEAGPLSAVVVIDDGLRMRSRVRFDDHTTLLDQAQAAATTLARRLPGLPPGTQMAIVGSHDGGAGVALTPQVAQLEQQLQTGAPHARPLGAALRAARDLLAAVPESRRVLVVLSDGAAAAWRDVPAGLLTDVPDVALHVVPFGTPQRTNIGLAALAAPDVVWPSSAAVPLHAVVRATGTGGDAWLSVVQQGEVAKRVGPLAVDVAAPRDVTVDLPPQAAGPHAATVTLEPDDLLPFDQARYVAWQTGPAPVVWLVLPEAEDATRDLTAVVLRNLLAPEALPADQQRVALRVLSGAALPAALDGATRDPKAAPVLVVLLSDVNAADAQAALRAQVEAGANLLLVPGSRGRNPDWPGWRTLLAGAPPSRSDLSPPTSFRWLPAGATPVQVSQPAELARCLVQRRLQLAGVDAEARVLATFPDRTAAVVARPLGRGLVVALLTSPDPAWSDLGIRAAGLLTWLHGLIEDASGPLTAAANCAAGTVLDASFGTLPAAGLVQIVALADEQAPPQWRRLMNGRPETPWPTERAGVFALQVPGDAAPAAYYAVNWPAEEFDLTPVTQAGLAQLLGTQRVAIAPPDEGDPLAAVSHWPRWLRPETLAGGLAVLLLLLFALEMHLAARRA